MNRLAFSLILSAAMVAQTKPTLTVKAPSAPLASSIDVPSAVPGLPEAILVEYWHAIAAHYAQNAAFQASMTAAQKQTQESIATIDKQLDEIRKQLAASCGDKATLDESGAEPICKVKTESPAK